MLEKLLKFAVERRVLILLATLGVAFLGIFNYSKLPIDAVPDITNVQVQINTRTVGYSPLEVEQRITFPIETVMSGLPRLDYTRSISRYGLSQVTVVFKEGTDIYFARQLVNERLQEARGGLPEGIEPTMGPVSTGLGEIFMWSVVADEKVLKADGKPHNLIDLREVQDWVIRPQLLNVPGVTEVNSIGGYDKQYHVTPFPAKLLSYDLSFADVLNALSRNNANIGAGYIEKHGEQYLIRAPGQVKSIDEIKKIVVKNHLGVPVLVQDLAEVIIGKEQRTGAATHNAKEGVVGTVFMLMGENPQTVAKRVEIKLAEITKSLPKGVSVEVLYNRINLVDKTISTVRTNLFEGAILVIVVLFLFLGNIRAALITAMVIPLSMLMTITGMVQYKVSGNLMSLGALDFGIIVDGAVIIVENCIRRLVLEQKRVGRLLTRSERLTVVFEASKEVRQATMFGELIIMIVYLPILTLTGVEGKMFGPMAFTVLAALIGAMILSVTFVPAAVALFMTKKISEKENFLVSWSKRLYHPVLEFSMKSKRLVLSLSSGLVVLCIAIAMNMGTEFIPSLDEGDIAMHAMRIPGTSLSQAIKMQKTVENELVDFPEVKHVFAKLGTAEVASDPMPPNVADTFIIMHPREKWPDPNKSKLEIIETMSGYMADVPGNRYEFTQPIKMRFNELISGVRADIAVKVFGDDMDTLVDRANNITWAIRKVEGAADVRTEQVVGLPVLTIKIDREKLARLGLNIADVQDVIEIAIGGKTAGKIYEGDRRFDLIIRLADDVRANIEELSRIPIPVPDTGRENSGAGVAGLSRFVTLDSVAELKIASGPNRISRENGKRRVVVSAYVRGRDLGTFVEDAKKKIEETVKMPPGYWITWGGQFEQMISAANRLKVVVPVALLLILILLFTTFGNIKDSLLVFTGVPFALTGGILSIWARGIPLSISAGVGFIALSGVAVLNGLVMISFINAMCNNGVSLNTAIREGAMSRLRPVLMTALVASLGFVPMALATGTGAEVQRPLATVVIGGIISSTLLTLVVMPVLYEMFHHSRRGE